MTARNRSIARVLLLAAATFCFLCGWYIAVGHGAKEAFGSHNADAYRYIGLAFIALALLA